MQPIRDAKVLARMRMAFDLSEAADVMMQQNLRCWFPHASEAEIAQWLQDWRLKRFDREQGPFRSVRRGDQLRWR